MKKNKVLTVVVPTYNVEKYLDRCMLSLVFDKEALGYLEIIIVNDGSKDGSLEVARQYEKQFPESVTLIDKENGGHGSTINAGLSIATGKYFRILDSDDWINIDDFGDYVRHLQKIDTDMVLTDYSRELVYSGTSVQKKYEGIQYDKEYDLNTLDLSILKDDYFYLATSTIKTEKLRDANLVLDENTFYVDMEYVILPIEHISTFVYWKYDIYRYWIGRPQQSIDVKNSFKNRGHHELVIKRLVDFYVNHNLSQNKKKYVEKIIVLMINSHYFIYTGRRLPIKYVSEVQKFDRWLRKQSAALYKGVASRFPYITYYRKTGFIFTSILRAPFFRISEVLAHRSNIRRKK